MTTWLLTYLVNGTRPNDVEIEADGWSVDDDRDILRVGDKFAIPLDRFISIEKITPPFATGGIVPPGSLCLVGEDGCVMPVVAKWEDEEGSAYIHPRHAG